MFATLKHIQTRGAYGWGGPQTQPMKGRASAQAQNAAGGYAFTLDAWGRLERFLILGTEGGSYYASEAALTLDNLGAVAAALEADGPRAVEVIARISEAGRAPKNDAAILALALAASAADEETRAAALKALPRVARIGTHLFQFAAAVEKMRGWGRGLRRAVASWYLDQPIERLSLQAIKYAGRAVGAEDGRAARWTHRDLLRLSHPETDDADRVALFKAILRRDAKADEIETKRPALAQFEAARRLATTPNPEVAWAVRLIKAHRLPREAVPTALLNEPAVWRALLEDMPPTALIRNLAKMTQAGVFDGGTPAARAALSKARGVLGDGDAMRRARVHPIAILMALSIYARGFGYRGGLNWRPVPSLVEGLDKAFYAAFPNVEPTGKRLMIAVDVSGSMGWGSVGGTPMTPREASTALAMISASVEKAKPELVGFSTALKPLPIKPHMRLDKAVAAVSRMPMGGTDCALPMLDALKRRKPVDAFIVLTDNETWAGQVHPMEALRRYREKMGVMAKLVVVGLTATRFSIADPEDGGALDVVGFDAAAPSLISEFIRD